jgi:hypothetical protein
MKALLALLLSVPLVVAAGEPSQLVTDFSRDLPKDDANAIVTLYFTSIRPLHGDTRGDVIVQLQRRNNTWATNGHVVAANYNQKSANAVSIGTLQLGSDTLAGSLSVTINPDSPRPGKKGLPNPADQFEVTVDARSRPGELVPWIPDPMPYMPPWRKDEPRFGGRKFAGTYIAKLGDTEIRGDVLAGVQPAPVAGSWGAEGNVVIQPGMKLLARLAPHRVAAPEGARAVNLFAEPQDWSAWDGLRITVGSDTKRDDATVALAIQRKAGSWHTVNSAGLLLGKEATFLVPFDDFQPVLTDRQVVTGISIGVNNPHGVGDVAFTVRKIELVKIPGLAPSPSKATITVDPESNILFNGVTQIPKGIFGVHVVGQAKPREGSDPLDYIRKVNPGMLRPLTHTGFGGKPISDEEIALRIRERLANKSEPSSMDYQVAKAGNAVDNVVLCHTTDLWDPPPWMTKGLPATAELVKLFYRNLATQAWVPGDDFNTLRKLEVWNEPFMWGRHINKPGGTCEDPTQYGYLPGNVGADAWSEIFLAAVDGAKGANPHVLLGGPSAPSWEGENYSVFRLYVARMLDRVHDKLDFITEHHYGGNPAAYAASYEVATAYMDVKHDRRVPIYNTEANDLGASSAGKATYNLADILHGIRVCPDKYVGRALHALWNGYMNDQGEEHAYTILSTLRGAMVASASSDPDVLVAAASPEPGKLVVIALNNAAAESTVSMPLPPGFALAETMVLIADAPLSELQLRDTEGQPIPKPSAGQTTLKTVKADEPTILLPRGSSVRWTFTKDEYKPSKTRVITQHFTDAVLAHVEPNKPVSTRVIWRGAPPKPARATLRLVTADVHRGEAVAVIDGHEIPLPRSSGNDGQAVVQEVSLDPSWVGKAMSITFRCTDPANQNGFDVHAASVMVEE